MPYIGAIQSFLSVSLADLMRMKAHQKAYRSAEKTLFFRSDIRIGTIFKDFH